MRGEDLSWLAMSLSQASIRIAASYTAPLCSPQHTPPSNQMHVSHLTLVPSPAHTPLSSQTRHCAGVATSKETAQEGAREGREHGREEGKKGGREEKREGGRLRHLTVQ